jgi:hypothetical protein
MNMKIALFTTLCLATLFAGAQTNTRVTGNLNDLQEGTVVYLSALSSSSKKDFRIVFLFQKRFGDGS